MSRPKITIDRSKVDSEDYTPNDNGKCCYLGLFIIQRDFAGNAEVARISKDFDNTIFNCIDYSKRVTISDYCYSGDEEAAKEFFYINFDYDVEFIGEYQNG